MESQPQKPELRINPELSPMQCESMLKISVLATKVNSQCLDESVHLHNLTRAILSM